MPPYSKRRNHVFGRALPGYNCCLAAPCQIDCRVILRHHCWADWPVRGDPDDFLLTSNFIASRRVPRCSAHSKLASILKQVVYIE